MFVSIMNKWKILCVGALVCVLGSLGCTIGASLDQKLCPCAPGYHCDETTNICVLGTAPDGGAEDGHPDVEDGDPDFEDTDPDLSDADPDLEDTDPDIETDADEDSIDVPDGMVYVPGSWFVMGCANDGTVDCEDLNDDGHSEETPDHDVYVDAFFIDIREVSRSEYFLCVDAGDCSSPVCSTKEHCFQPSEWPNHPIVDVTREQAIRYCEWLGNRLPTEAEWERAARGDDERIFPWGDTWPTCELANYRDCGNLIRPVTTHDDVESPFGTINMAGNVWEWVSDWYGEHYYDEISSGGGSAENPQGPAESGGSGLEYGVLRGGSFDWRDSVLRSSARLRWLIGDQRHVVGFRCVRSFSE